MRDAGIPTPDFRSFRESSIKELGRRRCAAGRGGSPCSHWSLSQASQGSALGSSSRALSEELPARWSGPSRTTARSLIERYVKGRGPRGVGSRRGRRALGAAGRDEAVPREEDFYDYDPVMRIGMTTFVCPASWSRQTTVRAQALASSLRLLGLPRLSRRVDLMLERSEPRAVGA